MVIRMSLKRYNFAADTDQIVALVELKRETGAPVSESIRRAIADYLKKREGGK
jgi:hypothetical protein